MTWRIVTLPDIVDKAVPAIQAAASACRARQQVAAPLMLTVVLDNRYVLQMSGTQRLCTSNQLLMSTPALV